MTPEQKAFYEYGRARAWLKDHRSKKYFVDVPSMGLYVWHLERDLHGLDALIRDAWQKRAACRPWMMTSHERICENCAHEGTPPLETPCLDCLRNQSVYCEEGNAGDRDNWEPRKEGE